MIRATIVSTVDQAILSALNFGLAILLIHFASKAEYGLYSQLLNLQSFFSPLHAGIFASAYLSLASKMDTARQQSYRTAMARAEFVMTVLSALLVIGISMVGAALFWPALTPNICLAFAAALLGLWWRDFVRQIKFSALRYDQVLNFDILYVLATAGGAACVLAASHIATSAVFWCMAAGAAISVAAPLLAAIRGVAVDMPAIRRDLNMSWRIGRWDVLGSVATWTYAQSYVYFAALHGGLDAAAEISAGRLLATPLALMWASYANVLRPHASRLLATGGHAEIRRLAVRSALFVAGSCLLYALAMFTVIRFLDHSLFGGKFEHLQSLTLWWVAYFMMTGISTVASSVLRSALEFRQVFHRQLLSCAIAVVLMTVGMMLRSIESLVIALVIVEVISAGLFWHRLSVAVSLRPRSI
jgi:O-antigen/teichoic acid export membrane protein